MLGVLVGGGATGGLIWLTSGKEAVSSTTEGTVTARTSASTAPTTSTAPAAEVTTSTTAATTSSTAAATETTATSEAATTTTGAATSTTATPTTTAVIPSATAGGLEVICKEAWGAAPIQGQLVEHQIERLTVHHTAVVIGSNTKAPDRIRSYQNYHQESGWPDIAYHYLIDAHGHIYEGRPVSAMGDTFTEYDPTGHFLVCCDGHFDQQDLPAAQLASLANVLAWASVSYGAGPSTIAGHRDYAATTCPGSHLAALIADRTLQSLVEQRITAGVSSLSSLCGQAGFDRVADIEAGRW